MSPIFPRRFVVRPTSEVARRFPNAWFARPHIWCLQHRPGHSWVGEAGLRLGVLAQIHEDAAPAYAIEASRSQHDAAELLESMPASTFDRLFTLEEIGFGEERVLDLDHYSLRAMRAVLPAPDDDRVPPPAWDVWAGEIERRAERNTIVLAALRYAVPKLVDLCSADLDGRGCSLRGFSEHVPPREACAALAAELGLVETGAQILHVSARRFEHTIPAHVEIHYGVWSRREVGRLPRRGAHGKVDITLEPTDTAWRVTSAALITETRTRL